MIYLKTGIGIAVQKEDMLLSAVQGNFSRGTFTCFARIENYPELGRRELCDRINRFFHENGLGRDTVVLGLPRQDVVLRHLDLPPEVKDNLREVIRYQVQALEPSEENGFYYDHVLLSNPSNQKRLTVLLAMVRKTYLDWQLGLLRECGIRPVAVTCGSTGVGNLWLQMQKDTKDKTFFLAEISKSRLEFSVLHNGQFAYSHETAKSDAANWGEILLAEVNEAVSRLRLDPDSTVEKIVLAGESAAALKEIRERIPDCELLEKHFSSATEKSRPFIMQAAGSIGLAFAGTASHSAAGLNLLPPSLVRRQSRWVVAMAAVLGVIALLSLAGLGLHETVQNRMLLSQLKEETKKLDTAVRRVRALETEGQTLQAQKKIMEGIVGDRDRNLDILRELTMILPEDTFITSYINRNGVIQMAGQSGSSSDLIPWLEKSPLLKDVVQRGAISRDPATGRDRFTFEARLEK